MKRQVLLVDDEDGIRKVLGISLADSGYDVLTAENGEEAWDIYRQQHPPIVLSDIKMPVMDGLELLRRIKGDDPDTEVIMITGHGDMDLAIQSLKLAATDFITKPVHDDALEVALQRAHERIEMRQQLRQYTQNLENLVREKSARLVELERQTAVGQAVEGFSAAMVDIAGDFDGLLSYMNELPCLVSVHNRDLEVVAANAAYRQRFMTAAGAHGRLIYIPGAGEEERSPVAETFAGGKGLRLEERVQYPGGDSHPVIVHTAPIRNREGKTELVLEVLADVSEIARLQQELRDTQHRYRLLFDAAPCYISVLDRDLRLLECNQRFKDDFGDAAGRYCYQLYKQRTEPCQKCPVTKTFEDGQPHQFETVVTALSGRRHNVLIWTAALKDANGEVAQVIEMSTDITQVRQLQDRLSSLGLMIGSVSHGIKGVLTGLDAGLYQLQSGIERDDGQRIQDGLDVLQLMVERVRKQVLDILYYAKERPLNWERVAVRKFVQDLAALVQSKLVGKSIRFVDVYGPDLGAFEADVGILQTALINVFDNAVEACLEDRTATSHRIELAVSRDGDRLRFQIRDDGVGMDAETRANVFNLFFSSKGSAGTGLGLFVSHQIVVQHGGRIEVESAPDRGATFCIDLPTTLPEAYKTGSVQPATGIATDTGGISSG